MGGIGMTYNYSIRVTLRNGKEIETMFTSWSKDFQDAFKNKINDEGYLETDGFLIREEDIMCVEWLNKQDFNDEENYIDYD
jgi:hypothetical protein